jgi:hypothetical protein
MGNHMSREFGLLVRSCETGCGVIWNLTYDGLIHFDENVAVQAYKRRVERDREVGCESK